MRLSNPQTFEYSHPNFQGQKVTVSLNDDPSNETALLLETTAPNGLKGSAILQMQDNGQVVIRVHLGQSNTFHVLILDDGGILLQQ